MTFWGADPDQLEILAARFGQSADLLDRQREHISWRVHHATWHGREGDHFRYEWDRHHALRMATAAHFLRESSDRLRRNAASQRQASGAGGGYLGAFAVGRHGWHMAAHIRHASAARHIGLAVGAGAAAAGLRGAAYERTALYRALHTGALGTRGLEKTLKLYAKLRHTPAAPLAGTLGRTATVASIWADTDKLVTHVLAGDTHNLKYDALWLGVDAVALSVPVVGVVAVGGKLLWHTAAADPKVMAKVHEAGASFARHHFKAAAAALVHGGGQLGTDLGEKVNNLTGGVAGKAARFLTSPVASVALSPVSPFGAAIGAYRFLHRHH